jgi:hypothetical protein
MPKILHISAALAVVAAALAATSASGAPATASRLPHGGEPVNLDPADFTTKIDNKFWPMRPGSRWVYRDTDSEGAKARDVVTVTHRTKLIANGITARVVHDVVREDGELAEVTDDYYAQDRAGNIWYLGEATTTYANGKPKSTEGSFEAGVDGAQPGVIMAARPRVGLHYRSEFYKGHAEDRARVMSLREMAGVPFGFFRRGRVLMTAETSPLEPQVLEYKFYARGVGPVLAVSVSGESDREELVRFRRAPRM